MPVLVERRHTIVITDGEMAAGARNNRCVAFVKVGFTQQAAVACPVRIDRCQARTARCVHAHKARAMKSRSLEKSTILNDVVMAGNASANARDAIKGDSS
jgi:hypothetical protein